MTWVRWLATMVHMPIRSAGPERTRPRWTWLLLALLATQLWAQGLQVIELQHRTAEDVLPVLQPLLKQGDALTGSEYRLFVRTDAATLTQIRGVLAQLDRKPRQLWISVRRATRSSMEQESTAGSVRLGTDGASGTVIATQGHDAQRCGGIASVQVSEGNSAFIGTGQSIPVVTSVFAGGGRRGIAGVSTGYRDLNSGVLVTPRISGDNVILEIEQQHQEPASGGNTVRSFALTTQVQGRLNEWISLGAVDQSQVSRGTGTLSRQYSTSDDSTSLWVKIEER